jgi:hypothetical protein
MDSGAEPFLAEECLDAKRIGLRSPEDVSHGTKASDVRSTLALARPPGGTQRRER